MNSLDEIRDEHRLFRKKIERIDELTADSGNSNVEDLVIFFKGVSSFWDEHENKEEELFPKYERISVSKFAEKVKAGHKKIQSYKRKLSNAVNSNNPKKIRKIFYKNWMRMRDYLIKHLDFEDMYMNIIQNTYTKSELDNIS